MNREKRKRERGSPGGAQLVKHLSLDLGSGLDLWWRVQVPPSVEFKKVKKNFKKVSKERKKGREE